MIFNSLFSYSPHAEILARNIYYRFPSVYNFFSPKSTQRVTSQSFVPFIDGDFLFNHIRSLPIDKTDILIIHSSFNTLIKNAISPSHFIDFLFSDVIPNGTIVCPTFPLYRNEPRGIARLNDSLYSTPFEYNVQKTRSSTGSLGRFLQSIPGSRRSLIPLNTVTANGVHVDQIFSSESLTPFLTPCGRHSPWYQLFNLNAKIMAIGTDLAHSLTMIPVSYTHLRAHET